MRLEIAGIREILLAEAEEANALAGFVGGAEAEEARFGLLAGVVDAIVAAGFDGRGLGGENAGGGGGDVAVGIGGGRGGGDGGGLGWGGGDGLQAIVGERIDGVC